MEVPETRYAKSGDLSIAYQVVGDGPPDLVYIPAGFHHVELTWGFNRHARFLERLASLCRLLLFDKRGTGMSDRLTALPTLEARMDDVRAVMEASGSERAALFGYSEGGPMCVLFAAVFGPGIPLALRVVEAAFAASVIGLLFSSAHLFPRAQLPRR